MDAVTDDLRGRLDSLRDAAKRHDNFAGKADGQSGSVRFVVMFVMDRYSGNLEIWIAPRPLVQVVAIGAAAYLGVAAVHIWRVRRVSLSLALKAQE